MDQTVIETSYPLHYRQKEVLALGEHLKHRHSVMMVGMKRVGISNFLRFFLYRKDIVKTYIDKEQKHLFIPVDLNDLVEKELSPFWTLTLKRIVDACQRSSLSILVQKEIESYFLDSIQSQDLFLTIDSIRRAIMKIVEQGLLPTIFFLRFDRIKEVATPEFFANLQGLKDATNQKLAYVFTSFQSLDRLSPEVFTRASLSLFCRELYLKPAAQKDIRVIYTTYKKRYDLTLSEEVEQGLFSFVDGYIQYLQLALIMLHERSRAFLNKEQLFDALSKDERIILQSEELWDSLASSEKMSLQKIVREKPLTQEDLEKSRYVWDTGMVYEQDKKTRLFSPLFSQYVQQADAKHVKDNGHAEFTKKEHLLYQLLFENVNSICEREAIIEFVWPEVESLGVSDWAIDRLVARVRNKLRSQKSKYEVQTVKTRGYKLVDAA